MSLLGPAFTALNDAVIAAFADTATLTLADSAGTTQSLAGTFDRRHIDIGLGGESADLSTMETLFTVRTADLPAEEEGQTLTLSGSTYRIVDRRPDSGGMTVLVLQKVA